MQVALYQSEYARAQAPQPVNRVGINLVGPTLLAHGTEDQRLRYLPRHPLGRGDLVPALQRARRRQRPGLARPRGPRRSTGATWSTGRKVWTSYAQFARGVCAWPAPSPDAPRPQQGITALIVDMADPGVDVRPLVQMTGDAEFNEVFLTDVFVPAEHVVGTEGQGWTVAGSTLAHERGTNFPFKEQVVHETLPGPAVRGGRGQRRARRSRWSPTRWRGPTSTSTCSGCTTCAP